MGYQKIPHVMPYVGREEAEAAYRSVSQRWVSDGPEKAKFESALAKYLGAKFCITASSGTAALQIAIMALGIQKKEIITLAASSSSTANCILLSGNQPVFIDADKDTYAMDNKQITERITSKTRAIIPVHIYGKCSEMESIMNIAKRNKLMVIEDAAQAMGSKYKRKYAGTFGDIGCFSFNVSKIITTGEGGCLVTNNAAIAKKARMIMNYGRREDSFRYEEFGSNFRLTNIQAAMGLVQVRKIKAIIARRRKRAMFYAKALTHPLLKHPKANFKEDVFFCYPLVLKKPGLRDPLRKFLEKKGIQTRCMFSALPKQPYLRKLLRDQRSYPVAEFLGRNGMYLSTSPAMTEMQIQRICKTIQQYLHEIA